MKQTAPTPRMLAAIPLLLALAACGQSPSSQEGTSPVQAAASAPVPTETAVPPVDDCNANAQIAVDFMNRYLRHLNDQQTAANPPETYDWLKANSLADPGLASGFAEFDLADGDPILDAQDFPSKFKFLRCPGAPGLVEVQGVDMNLMVPVKVASTANGLKVVGAGIVNMPSSAPQQQPASPNKPATIDAASAGQSEGPDFVDDKGVHYQLGRDKSGHILKSNAASITIRLNCDALSPERGKGTYGFGNGGSYIQFEDGSDITFSGQWIEDDHLSCM